MRPVHSWLSEAQLGAIYSADYWNDIETERRKEWWIEDGDYERCRRHLETSKLMLEYRHAETWVEGLQQENLRILDVAAGIGWTSALLAKLPCVAEVHAVEISRHRLERLFPHAVTMFGAPADKIHRYLGSFYDLRLPPQSMDVVYLSQAFHHADRPLHLLLECDRVLKPGGRILIIGEPGITRRQIARRFLGTIVRTGNIVTDFYQLFPPDRESGDHYYRLADYYFMFRSSGYRLQHTLLGSGNIAFLADKLQ
jgi:ubiquinone/menaquinone biosynthesis C-methylase UbiE